MKPSSSVALIPFTLWLLALLLGHPQAIAAAPPNVVLIFCDDLGYADIGPFGATRWKTPNLDLMAQQGRKLTNFHVSSAVCSASRAALLTGCYHSRVAVHGALGPQAKTGLSPSEMTLAELLKQKGYATAAFGKWHLGRPDSLLPTAQGFDDYFGLPYSGDMWPLHPETKPGNYPPLPLLEGTKVLRELDAEGQKELTTRYTERSVAFIDKACSSKRPFFLYLAHNQPHVPLFVSDKFAGKSGAGLYGDVIQEIDWSVGQVMAALKRNGVDENTLVIFTSDNGPWLSYGEHAGSSGPYREGKGTSWEGGLRVPFLIRWPGKIPAGSECRTMAMTIDLFPTIAELAQAPLPSHPIDGKSIWPLLSGEATARSPQDSYAFYYASNELQAISDGRWKLFFPHGWRTLGQQPPATGGKPNRYSVVQMKSPELYDLDTDSGEKNDLAANNPEIVQRLKDLAARYRQEFGDSLIKQPTGNGVRPFPTP